VEDRAVLGRLFNLTNVIIAGVTVVLTVLQFHVRHRSDFGSRRLRSRPDTQHDRPMISAIRFTFSTNMTSSQNTTIRMNHSLTLRTILAPTTTPNNRHATVLPP
jgi:hypothetical protein